MEAKGFLAIARLVTQSTSGFLDLYELSLTTDGPATTGTEVTVSASLVAKDNGSLALPADTHVCRFHWVHTPLMLTSKVEKDLSSTIRVVSNAPGDFPVSVWVTAANCWMCHQLARSAVTLPITSEHLFYLFIYLQRKNSASLVTTEMQTIPTGSLLLLAVLEGLERVIPPAGSLGMKRTVKVDIATRDIN